MCGYLYVHLSSQSIWFFCIITFPAINTSWRLVQRTETPPYSFPWLQHTAVQALHDGDASPSHPFITSTVLCVCATVSLEWISRSGISRTPGQCVHSSVLQFFLRGSAVCILRDRRRRLVHIVSSPGLSSELLAYGQSDRWERTPPCTVLVRFSSCGSVWVTSMDLTLFLFSCISPACSCLWLYFIRL